jgi:membrane protein
VTYKVSLVQSRAIDTKHGYGVFVSRTDEMNPEQIKKQVPGAEADKPAEIPPKGWLQVVKRGWAEAKADQVPLLAAGVAFYAFLAIFPLLIATVLLYGLIVPPDQIAAQIGQLTEGLPADVSKLITEQITLASAQQTGAGIGLALAVLLALWSASGGMGNLMTAISTAYDEEEKRNFFKKRGLALLLTLGAIVFLIVLLALVAVFPILSGLIDNGVYRFLLQAARWVLIAALVTAAMAVLYRVAPDRDAPKMRWVSVGAGVATVLFILASIGFSIYVANFGNYAKTYGALAGIVVMLFWLWITSYAVLLGAEINAESEQQTIRDTTKGPEAPLGERDAVKADTMPEPAEGEDPKAERKKENA